MGQPPCRPPPPPCRWNSCRSPICTPIRATRAASGRRSWPPSAVRSPPSASSDPVLARRHDRRLIAGHQRLIAARRCGLTTVPVILLDLSETDARLLNVALNQIGGDWDQDLLARLLIDLRATADRDLTLSGFSDDALADLLARFDQREKRDRPERFDLDEALAAVDREASGIAPGAGWQLGAHRLVRGDATDAAFLARCLGDGPAALVFTDPPYNVAYGAHGGRAPDAPARRLVNDAMPRRRVGALLPGLGGELDRERGRRAVRLHELQGVAAGRPGAGRGRGALVGHDHLGQGPLHAGPRRLSAPVRADLVRLAGRQPAALAGRARPGRRLAHPPPRPPRRCTPPRSRWNSSNGRSRTPAPPAPRSWTPSAGPVRR